ncbi:neuronal acetylcholine receptor subunit alpha-10-like [Physella acuta]|uniref:neuronal acetylcholine receptor subunit alpha-10-like n=1 Tax=Physella acuta TaxID=109671 RepID=UPI0027DDFB79|nr:neuronal acetylcholine receptor subunit alpha-10-like [Physella acuta]
MPDGSTYLSDELLEHDDPEPLFQSSEQKLMNYLVRNYDNSVRPVYDATSAVDVKLGLTLTQILDLDEKNQVLTTNVWLEAEWFDERLNWSITDFGGISSIRIPCQKLWLPDIVLYNSVDDYTSGYMPTLAMVYNNSRVFWGPVIRFRSSCKIDITFFPFDTQICKLKMGSWAYTGLQVNVWNSSNSMDLSNFVDNGEWELLGVAVQRNVVFYACCEEPFPDVTFVIQLRRRTKYYFMNIIIPCIILSFLCLGGFLLPSESGEKITLGLSVLLTITVFMLMVADKMPQTSESISVISIYLMAVLATSCLSVLSSVLILSIHHQRGRPTRPPPWLRKLCFNIITPVLCLRRPRDVSGSGEVITNSEKKSARGSGTKRESKFGGGSRIASSEESCEYFKMDATKENCTPDDVTPVASGRAKATQNSTFKQVYTPRHNNHTQQPQRAYSPLHQQSNNITREKHIYHQHPRHSPHHSDSSLPSSPRVARGRVYYPEQECQDEVESDDGRQPENSKVTQTYNVVVRYLIGLIKTKHEDEILDEQVFQEWHDIAFVLDRLLFYVFFFITLVSTVSILEMRPAVEKI